MYICRYMKGLLDSVHRGELEIGTARSFVFSSWEQDIDQLTYIM